MRKFFEQYECEALALVVTLLGVTKWWMPVVTSLSVAAALLFDIGLLRRWKMLGH